MNRSTRLKLANFLMFQAGWLACVLGAARGQPWLGPATVIPILAIHLSWARRPRQEAVLLAICGLAGLLFDASLLATTWVGYPGGWWLPGLAPYWMLFMWLIFGATLNLSMSWIRGRPLLAALIGAIGGPLAYLAGARLGGITFVETTQALTALAIGWALVLPLFSQLAKRLDGFTCPPLPGFFLRDRDRWDLSGHV